MNTDRKDMNTMDEDKALQDAVRRDRQADPAPALSEAAMARIMAQVPEPPARASAVPGIAGMMKTVRRWLRPPAWQALAAAGIAGVMAGAFLPLQGGIVAPGGDVLTPEEEFAAYLETGDLYASYIEEDL